MSGEVHGKRMVFVTVGSTSFEDLVRTVDQARFRQLLQGMGYDEMCIQYGRGEHEPTTVCPSAASRSLRVTPFRFAPSLLAYQERAALVISHAGAATTLEVLGLGKPLVSVVNPSLMDDHQAEIAHAFEDGGHLFVCRPDTLVQTLQAQSPETFAALAPLPPSKPQLLAAFLDEQV